MTDWSRIQKHYVCVNGREIPSLDYWRQRKFESLSDDAKIVLSWLRKKKQSTVTLVQMSKCLTPPALRTAVRIRQIMHELVEAEFAQSVIKPVYYSGRLRKEAWKYGVL